MSTTTVIEQMPMNWDVEGYYDDNTDEEKTAAAWRAAFTEWLNKNYPDLSLCGDEIIGPATYFYPWHNVQNDTPKIEDLTPLPENGVYAEFLESHSDDWSEVIAAYID